MKQVFEIVSDDRNGKTLSKKLVVEQKTGLALEVVQRDIKTERGYYDIRLKFNKGGKLTAIKLNFSRGLL